MLTVSYTAKKLYQDIFELQPPLILWLYTGPLLLSELTGIKDCVALVLCGLPVIALSIAASYTLLCYHPVFADNKRKRSIFAVFLGFLFIFFQNPLYFLDREHLFLILCFPYMLRFTPSLAAQKIPSVYGSITGIMAGVGFCIKPHFIVIFLGIQLACMLHQYSFSILFSKENRIIYLTVLLYCIAIWLLTPEYIVIVMPMLQATYSAYTKKYNFLLYLPFSCVCLGIILADFRLTYTSPYRKDIFYWLGLLPFFILYACINNGWGYTWNMLHSMILILNIYVLWEFLSLREKYKTDNLSLKKLTFGVRANQANLVINFVFVACVLFLAAHITVFDYSRNPSAVAFMEDVKKLNSGKSLESFGFMSLDFDIWSRIERHTKAKWETRFSNFWMLRKFDVSDAEFALKNKWILDYIGNAFAEDLNKNQPELIFVDHNVSEIIIVKPIDFIKYLSLTPAFITEWKNYNYIGEIDTIDQREKSEQNKDFHAGYAVYKRQLEP